MNIDRRLLDINFSTAKNRKLGICIHTMVGTLVGTDSYFRNPSAQVSSHYGVDLTTDKIYQWVEENHVAWAQGVVQNPTNKLVLQEGGNPNSYFISIECADNLNPHGADRSKQKYVIAELVVDIAKRNGIPLDRDHVCGHKEIYSAKTCPGNLDVDEILNIALSMTGDELLKLSDDIPTTVENKYNLKDYDWYNKYWTLADYMQDSIDIHDSYEELEENNQKVVATFAQMQEDFKKFQEEHAALKKKYEDLQKDYDNLKEEKNIDIKQAIEFIIDYIRKAVKG